MRRLFHLAATLACALAGSAFAGSFTNDFSNPTPSGFTLNGNSATRPDGSTFEPVITDGHLVLTYNENSEQGTIVLDDLDGGAPIESFTAKFKLQIGPGSGNPADGLAFCFGPEVDASANFGEEGVGNGIIVSFDIYDNGGGEAPAIDIKYNGAVVASAKFAKTNLVTSAFEDVEIKLARSGLISVSFKGQKVHDNVYISDFTPLAGLFAIGGRTGGENANQWLDDLSITTVTATPTAPSITTQPAGKTVVEGQPVSFTAGFDGSAPLTLQWLSNNVAIAGATNPVYSIDRVPFAANGSKFKLAVTSSLGTATSQEATLTVTPLSKPLTLLYAAGTRTFNGVRVWFSDPLDPVTAGTAANYKLSGGLTVTSAKLAGAVGTAGDRMVDLVTSAQTPGQAYTLTVSGVKDQTAAGNTIATNSVVQFSAWTMVQGSLLFEHWDGLSGAADTDLENSLTNSRVVANTPTTIGLATRFDSRTVFPDDSHENYFARFSGWITPTETADYYFFVKSDDASRLYLSTDDKIPDPATDTPIAIELDCCDPFYEPDSGDAATTASPISLVAGKHYGVLGLLKEGGGGDYMTVAWRKSTDTTAAADLPPIPGQFLSAYVDPNVDLVITNQPVSQPGSVASAGIEILTKDFNGDDGGFTVVNTDPPPPGPWIYNAETGKWVADGSEDACTGPYNSQLNSAPYKLTQDGAVSISFSHRYSFESGYWDGGQVRVSVN
ncbi:MAG TPA: hypothetical protein VHH73_18805, partial [Verrucomicrobiae bacterium]|nr:hypothetical protein [Verrucomicrobiae bacterium]